MASIAGDCAESPEGRITLSIDKVEKTSNKIEIKKAIEIKFNVKVEKVSVINVKGKTKSMSVKSSGRTIRTQGKKSSWKKQRTL